MQRRLSMRALAARANISTNHYQGIAHANANPSVTVLSRLADALGVSVPDLFESYTHADQHRIVSVADLKEQTTAHKRLSEIAQRIAT